MTRHFLTLRLLAPALTACCLVAPAAAQERMVTQAGDVMRRTCPSEQCGVVGRFYAGESVPVYESANGWTRVSRYHTAGCHDGRSAFVEAGASECSEANGILQGEFAEWVKSGFLAADAGG